jgi:hypothetical protein
MCSSVAMVAFRRWAKLRRLEPCELETHPRFSEGEAPAMAVPYSTEERGRRAALCDRSSRPVTLAALARSVTGAEA